MLEIIAVGIGGFIGSCARYGLTRLTHGISSFPFGILLSNVIAGILIGFFMGLEQYNAALPPRVKLFLTTGLLGGLSTFSTFSIDTVEFFRNGQILMAVGNITLNLILSLGGVAVGIAAAKLLFPGKN